MKNLTSHIDWKYFKIRDGLDEDKTFEFLCADFMQIHCNLENLPIPSGNSRYPGIEGEPVFENGKYYQFQAKFGDNAFQTNGFEESCKQVKESIDNGVYKLDVEYFFSKKDFLKKKESKEDYIQRVNISGIEIVDFLGSKLIAELKKEPYWGIVLEYFDTDKIKEEIYGNCETVEKYEERVIEKVSMVENGFEGNEELYKKDLKLAGYLQEKYTIRKLGYSYTSSILEKYDELEKDIADETFIRLELSNNYNKIDDFLDRAVKTLEGNKWLNKKYKSELSSLIPDNESIFINYGTEKQSALNYLSNTEIEFKDKR